MGTLEPTAKGELPQLPPASEKPTKAETPMQISAPSTEAHISLTGASKLSQQSNEAVREYFQDHLAIPPESKGLKEEVFKRCLEEYQKSVKVYEEVVGSVAFHDPQAKAYAQEYCRRMSAIVDAYNEVLEDENPSVKKNPLFTKEFMQKIRISSIFGNPSTATGSSGTDPRVISKALLEGNLRQQMTLLYRTVFDFLIPEILAKPDMIDKINLKLASLPNKDRFQIDKDLVEKEKGEGIGVIKIHGNFALKPGPEVDFFRNVDKGRESKKKAPPREGPQGPLLSDVQDLSLTERRVGTEFTESKQLWWTPGEKLNYISPTSTFYKELSPLGMLPVKTGPSGTTDGVLHIANYLGLGDQQESGVLALAGWMIPARDHSLHEIRTAARNYGLPYSGRPSDFETLCTHNPAGSAAIAEELKKKNTKNPNYYFSTEYQQQVLHDVVEEKRINAYRGNLDKLLHAASAQAGPISDLKNFNQPQEVKAALRGYNEQLRKIEAQMFVLDAESAKLSGDQPLREVILEKRGNLQAQYDQITQTKIDYVKKTVSIENQVYAMAIPRELPAGTNIYTAFKNEKIERLLFDEGFFTQKWLDPSQPATCYGQNFDPSGGAFGANELGEIGHYFSKDSPAYLTSDRIALHFALKENVTGAAIMSVTELNSRNFTGGQIEAGYKKLQTEYPFIQNDGLPPKDTELVFLKPYPLELQELMAGATPSEISGQWSLPTYCTDILYYDQPKTLHASWTTPPTGPSLKTGHRIQDVLPPSTPITKEPPQVAGR